MVELMKETAPETHTYNVSKVDPTQEVLDDILWEPLHFKKNAILVHVQFESNIVNAIGPVLDHVIGSPYVGGLRHL